MAETTIPVDLLVDIMTAEDGVDDIDQIVENGIIFKFIRGRNGEIVQICMSVERVTNRTAKDWMIQLGIDSLIISLFPPDEDLPPISDEKRVEKKENNK